MSKSFGFFGLFGNFAASFALGFFTFGLSGSPFSFLKYNAPFIGLCSSSNGRRNALVLDSARADSSGRGRGRRKSVGAFPDKI